MNILYKVIFCSLSDLCDVINCICMHYFLGPVWYNVIHRERGLGLAMLIGLICPIHSHPTYLFIQSLHTDTHININHRQKQTHNTGFGLVIAMIKWSRWPWLYPSCLFQSIYVSSIRNSQQKTLCWLKFSFNRWKVHSQIGTNAVETQSFYAKWTISKQVKVPHWCVRSVSSIACLT